MQAARGIVLPHLNSAKYAKQYNITQAEFLDIANDPILLNVLSEMCEKMFNVQINCLFARHNNIPEETERILVRFLLHISIDVRNYLKYNAQRESVVLPPGYVENPYKHRDESRGSTVYVSEALVLCYPFSLTFSNGTI